MKASSLGVLIGLALTLGCGSSGGGVCGDGEELNVDADTYCVYRAAITEEGFLCPPAFMYRHDFGDDVVCSSSEDLPDRAEERAREVLGRERDAALPDAALPDAALPDTAPPPQECDCRPGSYTVSGSGMGSGGLPFMVNLSLEITETCGEDPVCLVNGSERNCGYLFGGIPGGFRVSLDGPGFVQLIFDESACDEPWRGTYATEGGSAQIAATRVEE
ncbi:MAG: hypothetical protein AAGE52_05020 [Myxococcota bacterium]